MFIVMMHFPLCLDWTGKEKDEQDISVWEDNWEDDDIEDEFNKQLRYVCIIAFFFLNCNVHFLFQGPIGKTKIANIYLIPNDEQYNLFVDSAKNKHICTIFVFYYKIL